MWNIISIINQSHQPASKSDVLAVVGTRNRDIHRVHVQAISPRPRRDPMLDVWQTRPLPEPSVVIDRSIRPAVEREDGDVAPTIVAGDRHVLGKASLRVRDVVVVVRTRHGGEGSDASGQFAIAGKPADEATALRLACRVDVIGINAELAFYLI